MFGMGRNLEASAVVIEGVDMVEKREEVAFGRYSLDELLERTENRG